jgi:hypothetical protein
VEESVRGVTRPQAVALGVGLGVIFAGALIVGVVRDVVTDEGASEVETALLTVVIGVVVFVLGQIAQRFFIEPVQEQRTLRKEIAHLVYSYDTTRSLKKSGLQQEASRNLRRLSGQLLSTLWTVPYYRLFESVRAVRKQGDVLAASAALAGWALAVSTDDNPAASRHRSKVAKALDIPQARILPPAG